MGFLGQISYNVKNWFGIVHKSSLFAQISGNFVLDLLFYFIFKLYI